MHVCVFYDCVQQVTSQCFTLKNASFITRMRITADTLACTPFSLQNSTLVGDAEKSHLDDVAWSEPPSGQVTAHGQPQAQDFPALLRAGQVHPRLTRPLKRLLSDGSSYSPPTSGSTPSLLSCQPNPVCPSRPCHPPPVPPSSQMHKRNCSRLLLGAPATRLPGKCHQFGPNRRIKLLCSPSPGGCVSVGRAPACAPWAPV